MLSGIELGQAIKLAIEKKISSGAVKSKVEIARHFNVKPPSIHDWIKKGSISKDKLPELWKFFSDVVGPEHWGLTDTPQSSLPLHGSNHSKENDQLAVGYREASEERRAVVSYLLSTGSSTPGWVDSDARAYIAALDSKAAGWLAENKPITQSGKQRKTGS